MLRGIDISHHQANVDYSAVKAAGIDFVILRSSYGTTATDREFYRHYKGFQSVGVPVLGTYHFSYATSVAEAAEEGRRAVQEAQKVGLSKDAYIFFDLEYDSVQRAKLKGVTIDRAQCDAYTEAFCAEVARAGYKPGVYCNEDYRKRMYSEAVLAKYPLWYARYNGDPKQSYNCILHQNTSQGRVNGIRGYVDMNGYFGDALAPVTESETFPHWIESAGIWYYRTKPGTNAHGWANIKGRRYWFDDLGRMATGWRLIDGDWYYFEPDGKNAGGLYVSDAAGKQKIGEF